MDVSHESLAFWQKTRFFIDFWLLNFSHIDSILNPGLVVCSTGILREFSLISTGIPEELPKDVRSNMVGTCFHLQKKYLSQAGIALGNLAPIGMHICVVNIGHDIIRRTAMAKIIIVHRVEKATPD
jgi:hypothetical protein